MIVNVFSVFAGCVNTHFIYFFVFRFTTLSTPSMPVAPMNWASQPISGCGYWSSRTWTATVTGGWGKQEAGEVMCLLTTSANQNIHDQVSSRVDTWDCTWTIRRLGWRADGTKRQNHLDTLWLIFDLLSWSLIVRKTDYCCLLCS